MGRFKRVTKKHWRSMEEWECCGKDPLLCETSADEIGGCSTGCIVPKLYAHLAAYEDLGRTPDEIKTLVAVSTASTAPLRLDDLRGMDGEPVYCQSLVTGKSEWVICRIIECSNNWFLAFSGGEQTYGDRDTYGDKWLAYRQKPEGNISHGMPLPELPEKLASTCATCRWYEGRNGTCRNNDSDFRYEFVDADGVCEKWEENQ